MRIKREYSYFSGERKLSYCFSTVRTCGQNKLMLSIVVAMTLSGKQQSNSNTSL